MDRLPSEMATPRHLPSFISYMNIHILLCQVFGEAVLSCSFVSSISTIPQNGKGDRQDNQDTQVAVPSLGERSTLQGAPSHQKTRERPAALLPGGKAPSAKDTAPGGYLWEDQFGEALPRLTSSVLKHRYSSGKSQRVRPLEWFPRMNNVIATKHTQDFVFCLLPPPQNKSGQQA